MEKIDAKIISLMRYNRLNEKNQRQCGFKINSIWLGEFLKFIRLNRH